MNATQSAGYGERAGTGGTVRWGWAIGGALALLAVLVAASFGWVFVWSTFLHANTTDAEAQAYARVASPVVAIVLAGPLYFAAARLARSRLGASAQRTALALFGVDSALGALSLLSSPAPLYPALMCLLAAGVKLAALLRGVRG
jgi:hypothetical protein